jgi:hypothetical protein
LAFPSALKPKLDVQLTARGLLREAVKVVIQVDELLLLYTQLEVFMCRSRITENLLL